MKSKIDSFANLAIGKNASRLKSYYLKHKSPDILEITATLEHRLLIIFFFSNWLIAIIVAMIIIEFSNTDLKTAVLIVFLAGGILGTLIGIKLLLNLRQRRFFDLVAKSYFEGDPTKATAKSPVIQTPFAEIAGLEIIEKFVYRDILGKHNVYELWLVKSNGAKVQILNHCKRKKVAADAETLSQILKIKITSFDDPPDSF